MIIEKRNIALCVVLTIVTCGIYGLVWFVWMSDDTNTVSNEQQPTSGGIALLLSIVTCGIYGLYWAYKQGEKLDRAFQMRGMPGNDRSILYLLLSVFGLGIITYALIQDELNTIADADAQQYQQGYQQQYQQPYQQGQQYQQPYQQGQQYQQPYQQGQQYQQPYQQGQQYQQPYQQGQQYQQPYQQNQQVQQPQQPAQNDQDHQDQNPNP